MKRQLLLLTFLSMSLLRGLAAEPMPIIAYLGVPNNRSTDANFKTFSECGFNVSLYRYDSLSELVAACQVAQRHGVKILGHCPETHENPEKAAALLRDNKGFFGYVLQDEPSAPEIRQCQQEIERLKRIDDRHCFYINLHPYYADWTLQHTKTRSYAEYLDVATSTSCRQLSFDFYPVTKGGLRPEWYANLETIRRHAMQKGLPFWGFVLSVPHADYPQPTLATLRLQVYSNLAYGAQAIQYFTYWTPLPEKQNDYRNGPISHDGRKTKTYGLVQQMNRELATVAPLFLGAKVLSVNHFGVISQGTTKLASAPQNLSSLRISGKKGAVVSQLQKDGHTYLCLVNKDYEGNMKISIEAKNDVPCHITKKMEEERMKKSYTVLPGDMLLFRLN